MVGPSEAPDKPEEEILGAEDKSSSDESDTEECEEAMDRYPDHQQG